jgi:hypothetical protein
MSDDWFEVDGNHEPPVGELVLVWLESPIGSDVGFPISAMYTDTPIGWQLPDILNRSFADMTENGWCITHWQHPPQSPYE